MCSLDGAKILLVLFNSLFWLCGAALLGGGISVKLHPTIISYQNVVDISSSDPLVSYVAIIFIVIGAIAFVIGFVGCCGASKEQPTCLFTYALLLMLIMMLEVAAAVFVIIYRQHLEQVLKTEMTKKLENNYVKDDAIEKVISRFQFEKTCCGVTNYTDFFGSVWYNQSQANKTGEFVPRTCCVKTDDSVWPDIRFKNETRCQLDAQSQRSESKYLNLEGCYKRIAAWVESSILVMLIVAAVIVVIEMLGFAMACSLRNRLVETPEKEAD